MFRKMAELVHTFKKNQAMQTSSWLALEHGFEASERGANAMVKVLDDQHAVKVGCSSKYMGRKAADGAAHWRISFAFSRRDVMEHLHRWRGELDKVWFQHATISESGPFVADEVLEWGKDEPFEAHRDEIEAALSTAVEMANFETIERHLYEPLSGKPSLVKCAVNDALNGVDRIWNEYLAMTERVMSDAREPVRVKHAEFDRQLREFKAKHPDGIPR